MKKTARFVKMVLLSVAVVFCLYGHFLGLYGIIPREYVAAILDVHWLLLACLMVWCGVILLASFGMVDVFVAGFLLIACVFSVVGEPDENVLALLFGVTLGKGAKLLVNDNRRWMMEQDGNTSGIRNSEFGIRDCLIGLVLLLAFASWWHLNIANNFYHGPRWMGIWNSPNIYGLLMGAGLVLAAGLLAGVRSSEFGVRNKTKDSILPQSRRFFTAIKSAIRNPQSALLLVAALMMGVGLVMSYSRGAWVGTVIGLLYLARAYGKFKLRFALPGILVVIAVAWFFWNTPLTAPWYLQRLDLNRGSVQHRVATWRGSLQMMRDHPFGVGWNQTVETYVKNYSPPQNSVAAIKTNDYLMLGTQLGVLGLICFVAYVVLCFRKIGNRKSEIGNQDVSPVTFHLSSEASIRVACRAGALVFLVAFWFDGGLFKLATASVFWILLELGAETGLAAKRHKRHNENSDLAAKEHRERIGQNQNLKAESAKQRLLRSLRSLAAIKSAIGNRQSEIGQSVATLLATK